MAITKAQQDFLNKLGAAAQEDWNSNHIILPSITVVQGTLESGWGKSILAVEANNFFGIKERSAVEWKGPIYEIASKEYENGAWVVKVSRFRKYKNITESVMDHSNFLKVNKRYSNIIGVLDFTTVARNLQKDGYANDPQYANKLINMYKLYNLGQFDIGTANNGKAQTNTQVSTATGSNKLLTVQTGAYRQKENAEAAKKKLVNAGFKDAFIVYSNVDRLYRVQLGAYSVKANADKQLAAVKAKGFDAVIKEK